MTKKTRQRFYDIEHNLRSVQGQLIGPCSLTRRLSDAECDIQRILDHLELERHTEPSVPEKKVLRKATKKAKQTVPADYYQTLDGWGLGF